VKPIHFLLLLVVLAFGSNAWGQPSFGPPDRAARQLIADLERVEADAAVSAAVLRRDAFVVAQMAAATRELHDFQKSVAVQKALDRVDAAGRRAAERPPADLEVIRIVKKAKESLETAKERGFSTDFAALEQGIDRASRDLQPWVFRDILAMQKLRAALGDVQSRVGRMTQDLDAATGEVLASTLEDARE
jgi:hypothetical protein